MCLLMPFFAYDVTCAGQTIHCLRDTSNGGTDLQLHLRGQAQRLPRCLCHHIIVRALVCLECHPKSADARCPHAVCTMSARQQSIPQKHTTTDQTGCTFVSDASGHLSARSQTHNCYVLHQLPLQTLAHHGQWLQWSNRHVLVCGFRHPAPPSGGDFLQICFRGCRSSARGWVGVNPI